MGFSISTFVFALAIFGTFSSIRAQQPYVGATTTDCHNDHNSSSGLGYFCNGLNRSCQAYLTFRSIASYSTVSAISDLLGSDPSQLAQLNSVSESASFETNKLVLVPINCSCSGQFYQKNVSYVIRKDDGYFVVANGTFQSLSTCQAIRNQNSDLSEANLAIGQTIVVPLRCACPTKNQFDLGINYLLSYLISKGETVDSISERFGVEIGRTLDANEVSAQSFINFFTTLLVPLQNQPSSSQTIDPPPPPPPPPPTSSSPPSSNTNKSSNKTWVYVLVGVLGGLGLMLIMGIFVFFKRFQKRKKKTDSAIDSDIFESNEKPLRKKEGDGESLEFLESIASVAQSLKVYSFKELQFATDDFGPSNWIKGSVYCGTINGDLAAIKKMDGDVSKEINLLNKVNHLNLIRLSGVCFNEGHWYLVYEYAPNGPLSEWIHSNNGDSKFLNWIQRIQIALDVATGLDYLHSFMNPPHVHKDIKSSNILLDAEFRAKIANFGLARSGESQEGEFALTRHIVGTRGYMAPEYVENGLISSKLDVYSFGILMLEILTGKEVFELYGEENAIVWDVVNGKLSSEAQRESLRRIMDPSMQGLYPLELAVFVMSLISCCLKKDPADRLSMDEIVQSLSRTLSGSLSWESSQSISK